MCKLPVITLLLVTLLSACITENPVYGNKYAGKKSASGWLEIPPNPEMLNMAKFAARDLQNDSVLKVTEAKRQNILGTCYLLAFQMSSGTQWQAELYQDPYGKLTLLELLNPFPARK
ncbi:hypothetical protein ACTL6P_01175 [Endozoicomonas acroporae]|uniref:hypothetical protein n=1 Tax=Endozoicomonas acroporae TaxID=1701104 RepID=UPI000C75EE00